MLSFNDNFICHEQGFPTCSIFTGRYHPGGRSQNFYIPGILGYQRVPDPIDPIQGENPLLIDLPVG